MKTVSAREDLKRTLTRALWHEYGRAPMIDVRDGRQKGTLVVDVGDQRLITPAGTPAAEVVQWAVKNWVELLA